MTHFFLMGQDLNTDMYKEEMPMVNNRRKTLNMISHQGNTNQVRYYFTLICKANFRRQVITSFGEVVEKFNHHTLLVAT